MLLVLINFKSSSDLWSRIGFPAKSFEGGRWSLIREQLVLIGRALNKLPASAVESCLYTLWTDSPTDDFHSGLVNLFTEFSSQFSAYILMQVRLIQVRQTSLGSEFLCWDVVFAYYRQRGHFEAIQFVRFGSSILYETCFVHFRARVCMTIGPRSDCGSTIGQSNLVDPASSHMLVSKIKPCMSKYKFYTAKLWMAHYNSYDFLAGQWFIGYPW